MKLKKRQISDVIWIVLAFLLLFTPLGFYARVKVMRLFSFSPEIEKKESYTKLQNYNWNIISIDGRQENLSKSSDSIIVLNFWATWCPPCVAEMPSFIKLHKDYKDKVKFVFLASDEKEKVSAYLEKNAYNIPVFFDPNRAVRPRILDASSLPTTYVIDKSGNILIKEIGFADWNSEKVRTLLDSLLVAP